MTGWTWAHIDDEVTLPIFQSLCDYWTDFPPVHELFAAFVGVTPQAKTPEAEKEEWARFRAEFAGMSGGAPRN